MDSKPLNSQDPAPREETKYNAGVRLNKIVSTVKAADQKPVKPQTSPQAGKPVRVLAAFSADSPRKPVQHTVKSSAKPAQSRTLLYVGFAAAVFVVVALAVTMLIFSSSNSVVAKSNAPAVSSSVQNVSSQGGGIVETPTSVPNYIPPSTLPTAVSVDPAGAYEAPVIGQGGTCIDGSIIDKYHNLIGYPLDITIKSSDGAIVKTLKSDTNGYFHVEGLPAGRYTITIQLVDGAQAVTPVVFDVVLNGTSASCAQVRAKFDLPGCVVAMKRNHDLTGRTVGIPGWGFALSKDSVVLQGTTDSDGNLYFPNLETGVWTLSEEVRDGWFPIPVTQSDWNGNWIATIQESGGQVTILNVPAQPWWNLPDPQTYSGTTRINVASAPYPQERSDCQPVPVVNKQIKGSILVKKLNEQKVPMQGWQINLTRKDGTQPPQTGMTDSNGLVCFDGLQMGEWIVEEVLQPDWIMLSGPNNPVNLTQRQDCSQVEPQVFINQYIPKGCVDGYKINDLEQVLPDWKIKATNLLTKEVFSTVTDSNGYFRFSGLTYGNWEISELVKEDWTPVTPSDVPVTIDGPECKHLRFKNRINYACLDVYKKDSFDGSGLPGWTINLKPKFGGTALAPKTTLGDGWVRFDHLTPGDYVVSEVTQDGWYAPYGDTQFDVHLEASGTCAVVTFCNLQTNMGLPCNKVCSPGVLGISSTPVDPGDWVAADPGQVPGSPSCRQTYVVRRGDTFYGIANTFGVQLYSLSQANPNVNPMLIYPNMSICIP